MKVLHPAFELQGHSQDRFLTSGASETTISLAAETQVTVYRTGSLRQGVGSPSVRLTQGSPNIFLGKGMKKASQGQQGAILLLG